MSKLSTRPTFTNPTIKDTDIFWVNKDNLDGTFTSQQINGADMKTMLTTSQTTGSILFADLATTEPLNTCTYYNGIGGDGVGGTLTGNVNGQLATISNATKIDNVVTAINQVILVWKQADQKQNGLYKVTQLGSVSLPFILTRSEDADQQSELYPIQVNTYQGQVYANRSFLQKTIDPIIGTSNIVFSSSQIGQQTASIIFLDTATSTVLPTCTYASGTNTQIPGIGATLTADVDGALGTINGISLTANMRVLVKDQVNTAHNGDYTVTSVGDVSSKWKLTRISSWGSDFIRSIREWKINNSGSAKYGARYSTNLSGLSNINVGITGIVFNEKFFSGTNTGDQTFLNARVQTVTSSATVTPVSTNDLVIITAQAVGLTLANPTGTFTEGQALMIRIKDNGTARSIAYGTNYRAIGVTLPTTTVISKTMYLGIIYNSTDSKWDVLGYNIQA